MQPNTSSQKSSVRSPNGHKRRARTGWYSELTRDKAFGLSMDKHESQAHRIYALLMHEGKLTRHQIAEKLDIPLHTVCARVKGLMDEELVIDTAEEIHNTDTKMPNNLVKAVEIEPSLF